MWHRSSRVSVSSLLQTCIHPPAFGLIANSGQDGRIRCGISSCRVRVLLGAVMLRFTSLWKSQSDVETHTGQFGGRSSTTTGNHLLAETRRLNAVPTIRISLLCPTLQITSQLKGRVQVRRRQELRRTCSASHLAIMAWYADSSSPQFARLRHVRSVERVIARGELRRYGFSFC